MNTTTVETSRNPGCLIQILWFLFVGWWLGQAWAAVAWFLTVTIIGMPIGIAMLNKLPKVIALREPGTVVRVINRQDGSVQKQIVEPRQVGFLLRALYFLLIGWWFSALWVEAAFAISLTIIGLPIGFWMFDRVPAVLTLKQS